MWDRVLADGIFLIHLGFIVFVVLGGALLPRWPRLAWLHLPAALWGIGIEISGQVCPLTPWENHFRRLAGEAGYPGGFVEHYLLPIVYPSGLTTTVQYVLAGVVLVVNMIFYARWWIRREQKNRSLS